MQIEYGALTKITCIFVKLQSHFMTFKLVTKTMKFLIVCNNHRQIIFGKIIRPQGEH